MERGEREQGKETCCTLECQENLTEEDEGSLQRECKQDREVMIYIIISQQTTTAVCCQNLT